MTTPSLDLSKFVRSPGPAQDVDLRRFVYNRNETQQPGQDEDEWLKQWTTRAQEEHTTGFFKSLGQGALAGLVEPFQLLGLDASGLTEADNRTGAGKFGYWAGYLASFMVPAGFAYKGVTKALKGRGLISHGDDLFVRANSLRDQTFTQALKAVKWKDEALVGSATGVILGAGMSSDVDELGQNVLIGAVTGALGDPLMAAGMKVAAGLGAKAIPKGAEEVLEKVFRGRTLDTIEEVDLAGRAATHASEVMEPILSKGHVPENRLLELENVLRKDLEMGSMLPFQAKVVHGMSTLDDPLEDVLKKMSDVVEYARIERQVGGPKSRSRVYDYIVALRGHLDERLVAKYKETAKSGTPWFEGQAVRHDSMKWSVVKRWVDGEGDEVFDLIRPGMKPGAKMTVKSKLVSPEPGVIQFSLGPTTFKDAPKLWVKWLQKHGSFVEGDFDEAFDQFVAELRGYTTKQVRWLPGGLGQEGKFVGNEVNIRIEDLENVLPQRLRKKRSPDSKAMKYITSAIDTRQPVAPVKVTAKVTNGALEPVDIDGLKRLKAAKAIGEDVVPIQVEIVGNKRGSVKALKENKWIDIGTGEEHIFGQLAREAPDMSFADITGQEVAALREFFVESTYREMAKVDPKAYDAMAKAHGRKPIEHPDGPLNVFAAQNGYAIMREMNPATGNHDWIVKNINPLSGNPGAEMRLPSEELAFAWIKSAPQEMPNLTFGVNFGVKPTPGAVAVAAPFSSASRDGKGFAAWKSPDLAMELGEKTAAERLKAIKLNGWWRMGSVIGPREAVMRGINDKIIEEAGVDLGITRAVHNYMQALDLQRKVLANGLRPSAADGKTLGFKELLGIRGGDGLVGTLKTKHAKVAGDLLMEPNKVKRAEIARGLGFDDAEIKVIDDLEDFMIRLFEEGQSEGLWNITGDEFLQYYWPAIREKAVSGTPNSWVNLAKANLKAAGKKFDTRFEKFQKQMSRTSDNPQFETDPFLIPVRYLRAVTSKKYVGEASSGMEDLLVNLKNIAEQAGDGNPDLKIVHNIVEDYYKTMIGTNPEQYAMARLFTSYTTEQLGIELQPKDFDKLVNTLMSLNYGAFMGFRPGLAIRNLSQLVAVTLPVVQDPVAFATGIRKAFTEKGREAARKAGAVSAEHGIPFEDVLYTGRLYEMFQTSDQVKGKVLTKLAEARRFAEKASEVSLGTRNLKVLGIDMKVGFYNTMDEFNRTVSYHAMIARAKPHLLDYKMGKIGYEEAARKAGVSFLGESHMAEVKRLLDVDAAPDAALDYIGVRVAHETQWIYKQGAGPAWMSTGAGKLFGQYGTWPAWYVANIYRGLRAYKNDPIGAARFTAWNVGFMGAVTGATALTGYDWSKYNPALSVTWAGGPIADKTMDMMDVVSGLGSPDAKSQIALAKMGLGSNKNMWKTFEYFGAPFIPGALAFKEMKSAMESATGGEVADAVMKGVLSTSPAEPSLSPGMDFSRKRVF